MLVLISFLILVVNLILVAFSFFLPGIGTLIGTLVKSLGIPLLIGVAVGEALNAVDFVSLVEDPVATLRDQTLPSARVQLGQAGLALLSGLLAFLSMAFGWSAVKQSWGSEVAGAKSVVSGAAGFRAKAGAIWNLMKYLGKVILLIIGVALSFLSLLVGTVVFVSALHWAKVPGFVSLYVALFSGLISLISLAIAIIVWLPGQMKSAGTSITDVGWNGLKTLLQLGFQKEASFVLAGASLLIAGAGIVVAVICHPSKCP